MKKILLFLVVLFLFAAFTKAWAGCANLSGANKWERIDTHTIIIYRGSNAIALLKIPYCYIYPSSNIRIIKENVCNWDKIIIDDEACDIRNVERL